MSCQKLSISGHALECHRRGSAVVVSVCVRKSSRNCARNVFHRVTTEHVCTDMMKTN